MGTVTQFDFHLNLPFSYSYGYPLGVPEQEGMGSTLSFQLNLPFQL